jgi:hypothetical protein
MNQKYLFVSGLALAMTLTACGGGGDHDDAPVAAAPAPAPTTPAADPAPAPANPAPTTTASAEGVYEGTTSNGFQHLSLVLDDSTIYSVYGNTTGSVFAISRFLRGQGASSNGSFTATSVREYGAGAASTPYSLSGTYVAGASLNGTLTNNGTSTTFTGTALANSSYVYNTPAKLSNITGAWSLTDLTGAKVAVTVAADGTFTGTSGSCAITGSLTPKTSGKNVFTFSVTSGAAPCPLPGAVMTGVAVEFAIGTTRQLIAAGTDSTSANGAGWVGAR